MDSNPQIDENEELVKRLEEETASLKEEVARLHSDLSSEREKLEEVMSAYAAENEEAMNEFVSLKSEKEDLMADDNFAPSHDPEQQRLDDEQQVSRKSPAQTDSS